MRLRDAIEHAKRHWMGMRKAPTFYGWADHFGRAFEGRTLDAINYDDLILYATGLTVGRKPATIYGRMSAVSVIYDQALRHGWSGPKPIIPYPHVPKVAKWWLRPEQQEELEQWLTSMPSLPNITLRSYVSWACMTGLRVEETLRLTRGHFSMVGLGPFLMVPGTKTEGSEAFLPISLPAWELAMSRFTSEATPSTLLFSMTYLQLYEAWTSATSALGWSGASLKALRRSYARGLFSRGCPLPQAQQLMRHGSPHTTMEYMRLVGGGFNHAELAKWL